MKTKRWILTIAVIAPTLASAQVQQAGTPTTKVALERMQTNVARVSAERERWQANVAMWNVVLGKPDGFAPTDSLNAALVRITKNVATVKDPAEKERWDANIALWQAFIGGEIARKSDAAAIEATFGKMKRNVANIAEPAERERWDANCALWQAMLAPKR